MATESELRRICLGLPGAYEQASYNGSASFRTKPRVFARILEDGERVALWVSDEDEKLALVAAEPGVFSTTPHYRGYPIVLVYLGAVDSDTLRALVTDSWRLRAPAKLLQEPGMGNVERGIEDGWIRRGSGAAPGAVVRVPVVPGTPDTTELIRRDRDA